MSTETDFDRWKKNVYPKYWSRASKAYGIDAYCRGLIRLVQSHSPRTVFELAIGNGFPFAGTFSSSGIEVAGCDISADLLAELRKDYPRVQAELGGYENAHIFPGRTFDLVYCFRSTWHFPDLEAAIEFMLGKASSSGTVIFDIMNSESPWSRRESRKKLLLFPVTIVKNILKTILNWLTPGRWMLDKVFGFREIMYSKTEVERLLRNRGLSFRTLTIPEVESLGGEGASADSLSADQKIVFVVTKAASAQVSE